MRPPTTSPCESFDGMNAFSNVRPLGSRTRLYVRFTETYAGRLVLGEHRPRYRRIMCSEAATVWRHNVMGAAALRRLQVPSQNQRCGDDPSVQSTGHTWRGSVGAGEIEA